MGECKMVDIKDLLKGNKRICLSALRVFNKCELCPKYEGCDSRVVNHELLRKQKRITKLKQQQEKIKKELNEYGGVKC